MKYQISEKCTWLRATVFVNLLIINFMVPSTHTFNLDTSNYIVHEGEPESMFGFSVALHKEQQKSWVIIGAPRADTSRVQQKVYRGGAVYRCDISYDNRCHLIPFDSVDFQLNAANRCVNFSSASSHCVRVWSSGIILSEYLQNDN